MKFPFKMMRKLQKKIERPGPGFCSQMHYRIEMQPHALNVFIHSVLTEYQTSGRCWGYQEIKIKTAYTLKSLKSCGKNRRVTGMFSFPIY